MRKTHYIRFVRNDREIEMRLRAWARENQNYFPNYGFTNMKDDHPITHLIKNFCIRNLNARIDENERRVIVYI